jgi:hypothetical protein
MRTLYKVTIAATMVIFIAVLQSCQKEGSPLVSTSDLNTQLKDQPLNVFYGPAVPIGKGVGRAWVQENRDGTPVAVGLALSEKALEGLPQEGGSWVLFFPVNKGKSFYKHMLVDWNPNGHPPVGIYDKPHFDFHFYCITNEERLQIGPEGAAGFDSIPAPQYIPPYYFKIPGGVVQMGAHWGDLLSPEFNGGPFTRTFIYGSWMGAFIFYEPMVTLSYLLTKPDGMLPVRQPSAFARDGWYPMNYGVSYTNHPGMYNITLLDLTFHSAE